MVYQLLGSDVFGPSSFSKFKKNLVSFRIYILYLDAPIKDPCPLQLGFRIRFCIDLLLKSHALESFVAYHVLS